MHGIDLACGCTSTRLSVCFLCSEVTRLDICNTAQGMVEQTFLLYAIKMPSLFVSAARPLCSNAPKDMPSDHRRPLCTYLTHNPCNVLILESCTVKTA